MSERLEMAQALDEALHGAITARAKTPKKVWEDLLGEVRMLAALGSTALSWYEAPITDDDAFAALYDAAMGFASASVGADDRKRYLLEWVRRLPDGVDDRPSAMVQLTRYMVEDLKMLRSAGEREVR